MERNRSNRKLETTKLNWLTVALAIALASGVTVASAASMSLNPTDQSDVNGDSPTKNFSAQAYSRAGCSATEAESPEDEKGSRIWTTYLKFRIASPSDAGPITNATLTLDLFFVDGTQLPMGLNPKYVSDDRWSASTLTFDNAPAYSDPEVFASDIASQPTVALDVTEFLKQGGEGFGHDLSIAVLGRNNEGGNPGYSEWVRIGKARGSGSAPVLTINYIPKLGAARRLDK